ncbi:farnesyl pyrophosphate synthase-like [Xenia sp. Carnegie-2017]|uniref:farnesyl pyrophosphate synthase-like n=1 Tax=Xenia sp. Carnegie-2017 TaxID=2897299 RepID=UPI001F03FD4F|nr:farnesyl pyrophosphate synthase-like [Xenia sp. Carnegie-2017]
MCIIIHSCLLDMDILPKCSKHCLVLKFFFPLSKLISRQTRPLTYTLKRRINAGETNLTMNNTPRKNVSISDKKKLNEALPRIIDQIIAPFPTQTRDAMEHYKKSVMYNVLGGKMNRAMTVLATWRLLRGDSTPNDEELFSVIVLAWCIELLQASFLVADDVMDQSTTRRGKPCWYKKEDVGLSAINDAFMLESSVYKLVDLHFRGKKCYPDIISLFHETVFQTEVGQTLDMITKPGDAFCNFTIDRYKSIVTWKTAYYSFYLPVAAAMFMVGITEGEIHEKAKEILMEMGEFFQIQDDYLDCYGDPDVTGKVGTDIEDEKCSWLLVQALQKVDEEQLGILKVNYGVNDPAAVAKVKDIYSKLDLKSVYHKYEDVSYDKLMKMIEKAPSDLPKEIFTELASKIYKRNK